MCDNNGLNRFLSLAAALVLAIALPVLAQPSSEGYDPMRQITHQFAHPNLLIVLDVTGSMAYEQTSSSSVGVDSFGLPRLSWTTTHTTVVKGDACHWTYGVADRWYWTCIYTYTLNHDNQGPSRMDVFKNALGNSVPLYNNPAITWPASWPQVYSGYTYIGNGKWTVVASSSCRASSTTPGAPGAPFNAGWSVPDYSQIPPVTPKIEGWDPGLTPSTLPQDLVGQSKGTVNWGLMTFSTNGITVRQYVQADDTPSTQDTVVAALEGYFRPQALGGLSAGGSTNTSQALDVAKQALADTYNKYGINGTDAHPVQDGQAACGRVYGAVLVTDGQSNRCNDSGCSSYGTSWSCDIGYSTTWPGYPAGRSDEIFLEKTDSATNCTTCRNSASTAIPARTFVIGVSNEVARCELNLDAYFGRTDATSPNGDAGMAIDQDYTTSGTNKLYRLPLNVTDDFQTIYYTNRGVAFPAALSTTGSSSTGNYRPVVVPCTDCKDYAFFANDPLALYDAVTTIIGAVAAGDYTTSAPVADPTTTSANHAYLPSADFPTWEGHLYCYTCDLSGCTLPSPNCDSCTGNPLDPTTWQPAPPASVLLWDAAEVLNSQDNASRRIYTWDTNGALVRVAAGAGTLTQLKAIAAAYTPGFNQTSLTSAVVDFILGNNGAGAPRTWKLGPVVNSTVAVIGPPEKYYQTPITVQDHKPFADLYKNRVPLVWVGSDDGMMHAFLTESQSINGTVYPAGTEMLAILPPNLIAKQVSLYSYYNPTNSPTGQPKLTANHIYGVANSPRFGDVYFPAATPATYKTVLYLTEGTGGDLVAGLDVTDVVGNIKNSPSSPPFGLLWQKRGSDTAGLKSTWSIPAMGYDSKTTAKGAMGSGYDSTSATTSPYSYTFDPTAGGSVGSGTLAPEASPSPWVRNQAFADAVIFRRDSEVYAPDNIVTQAVQADLNGQVWFLNYPGWTPIVGIDASAKVSNSQPIYYPPSVAGYKNASGTQFDLYAFASGTFYEKSSNVTGPTVGTTGHFTPTLFFAVKQPADGGAVTAANVLATPINSLIYTDASGVQHHLSGRSQVTAPQVMLVKSGSTYSPAALYLIYDPESADCAGTTYLVATAVTIAPTGAPSMDANGLQVLRIGSGAGAGFGAVGGSIMVSMSGIGEGSRAHIVAAENFHVEVEAPVPNSTPLWYRELQ